MGSIPKDMSIAVEFGGPFGLAAVAFALVGRHDWSENMVCFVYASVLLLLFRFEESCSILYRWKIADGVKVEREKGLTGQGR